VKGYVNVTLGVVRLPTAVARRLAERGRTLYCPTCKGDGRDPDHWKNACSACGGDGKAR
jgi:DnaJ-class molecular chaperone